MKHFPHIVFVFLLVASSSIVVAQEPPTPSAPTKTESKEAKIPAPNKDLVASTKPMDAAGQKQIKDFITNRFEKISGDDVKESRQATTDILLVLRQSAATPMFLRACFDNIKPYIPEILAKQDSFRTGNMLEIVRWTQTPDGLDILIEQVNPSTQKNTVIRMGASRLLAGCIASASLTAPQIDRASRRIREASEFEPDWIVSMHEMESLAQLIAISQNPTKPDLKLDQQLKMGRDEFLKILAGTAAKVSNPKLGGTDQIFALQRGLIILRDMLLKTPKNQVVEIASIIRPITEISIRISNQIASDKSVTNGSLKESAKNAAITANSINTLLGVKPSAPPAKTPA